MERWGLAGILTMGAALLALGLTEPFVGHHDWNSAWVSAAARNHLRYGLAATGLGVIENNAPVAPEWFQFYTSHPPLVPLVVGCFFFVLGELEWVARIVPAFFTLASIALVYAVGRSLGGRRLGLASSAFFMLLPGISYFGRVVNHEPFVMAFSLGGILAYVRWHRGRGLSWLALSVVLVAAAALSDWPGYYLGALLPAHHFLTAGPGRRDLKVLVFPAVALMAFALHLGHILWLQGESGLADLAGKFLYRTRLGAAPGGGTAAFGFGEFLYQKAGHAYRLFTPPLLVLALLGLGSILRGRDGRAERALILLLLAWGTVHVLLFPAGAFYHDYWLLYLAPGVALLAAAEALRLTREGTHVRAVAFILGVVVLSSAPQLQYLHQRGSPATLSFAAMVQSRTQPHERLLTNVAILLAQAPQVGYYALRDVSYDPVTDVTALRDSLHSGRPFGYLYSAAEDESGDLGEWLQSNLQGNVVKAAGATFRLYRRPAEGRRQVDRR